MALINRLDIRGASPPTAPGEADGAARPGRGFWLPPGGVAQGQGTMTEPSTAAPPASDAAVSCRAAILVGRDLASARGGPGFAARKDAVLGFYVRSSPRSHARHPDSQTAEIQIRGALMNRFSALGTAEIIRVA